jgi:hypothetical protein
VDLPRGGGDGDAGDLHRKRWGPRLQGPTRARIHPPIAFTFHAERAAPGVVGAARVRFGTPYAYRAVVTLTPHTIRATDLLASARMLDDGTGFDVTVRRGRSVQPFAAYAWSCVVVGTPPPYS